MLLAVDAGNTNIVFALFDGDKDAGSWRMRTSSRRTSDEYASFLINMLLQRGLDLSCIDAAIVGSVVPDANFPIARFIRDYIKVEPLFVGDPKLDMGLPIRLQNPQEVGADRLINAVAGIASYKLPLLLVDFGTATTFDVVDAEGAYCGGAIAPGANLALQALHMAAAKLPRVAIARPSRAIGTTTIEAIQSGTFWGYVGLVNGIINQIRKETELDYTIIATGGLAALFRDALPVFQAIDTDLTLRGLLLIYKRNQER